MCICIGKQDFDLVKSQLLIYRYGAAFISNMSQVTNCFKEIHRNDLAAT